MTPLSVVTLHPVNISTHHRKHHQYSIMSAHTLWSKSMYIYMDMQNILYTQRSSLTEYTLTGIKGLTAIKSGGPSHPPRRGMAFSILRYTFVHEVTHLCTSWPQQRGGNWFVVTASQVNWLCRILYIVCVCMCVQLFVLCR